MRAAFGLVGILITLGVIVWILGAKGGVLDHDKAVIDAGNKATEQVNQLTGHDRDTGGSAKDCATLEAQTTNGTIDGILVTSLVSDGAYAKFWALKRSDVITEIGPLPVKGSITSERDATDMMLDAYQHHYALVVMRDGQKTPLQGIEPGSGKSKSGKSGDSLQNQLDTIQSIPTH